MKEYFTVTHADLNDGSGPQHFVAAFTHVGDAQRVASRKEYCIQGIERHPAQVNVVQVYEGLSEFDDVTRKSLRQQAWNKLTPAEREALSLQKP